MTDDNTQPLVLTFTQACLKLQVGEHTLRRLIVTGEIRAGKVGSTWRIRPHDIEDYLDRISRAADGPNAKADQVKPKRLQEASERPSSWEHLLPKASRNRT